MKLEERTRADLGRKCTVQEEAASSSTHDDLVISGDHSTSSKSGHTFTTPCDFLNALGDSAHIFDSDGTLLDVNQAFAELLASARNDVLGTNLEQWYEPLSAREILSLMGKEAANQIPFSLTSNLKRKDGTSITLESTVRPLDSHGRRLYLATSRDVTKRLARENRLRLKATAFTHSTHGVLITDKHGNIVTVNRTFTTITGFRRNEVIGLNPRILSSGKHDKSFFCQMWHSLEKLGFWQGELWNKRKSGEVYAETLSVSAICDSTGLVQNYVGTFSDITPSKMHEDRLNRIANYDVLTDLPNRLLFNDRLNQAILQHQRGGPRFAVVYIDLDGFKAINDAHGHEVGDHLLCEVTTNMKVALREVDTLSRFGGDEFVALLVGPDCEEETYPYLDRILAAARRPVRIANVTLGVTASLGVAFCRSERSTDIAELLKSADRAMYVAKTLGKNRYSFSK